MTVKRAAESSSCCVKVRPSNGATARTGKILALSRAAFVCAGSPSPETSYVDIWYPPRPEKALVSRI